MQSIQFFWLVENSCLLVSASFFSPTMVWESLKRVNFLLAETWMVNLCSAMLQFLWSTGNMGYCLWIEKVIDLGCKSGGWSLTAFGPGGTPLARTLEESSHSAPSVGKLQVWQYWPLQSWLWSSGPGTESWHCLVCTTLRATRAQQGCKQGSYPMKRLWEKYRKPLSLRNVNFCYLRNYW